MPLPFPFVKMPSLPLLLPLPFWALPKWSWGCSCSPSLTAGKCPKYCWMSASQSSTLLSNSPTRYKVALAGKYHFCQKPTIEDLSHCST